MPEAILELLEQIPARKLKFGVLTDDVKEQLDIIGEEQAKRGTLQGENIDYSRLLEASYKTLNLAGHLAAYRGAIVALMGNAKEAELEAALLLGCHLFEVSWPDMHPMGPRAQKLRISWANDILAVISQAIDRFLVERLKLSEQILDLLGRLNTAIANLGLSTTHIASEPIQPEQVKTNGRSDNRDAARSSEPTNLDAKARAKLRQDITALAARIDAFTHDAPVAYWMRDYVAWMERSEIVPHQANKVVDQEPLPRSIQDQFRAALKAPQVDDLQKIEERLIHSPDWFYGQFIAARMAGTLGYSNSARAIRARVIARLEANPELLSLRYANGEPFVPDEVKDWQIGSRDAAKPSAFGDTDDVGELLFRVEESLAEAKAPRDLAYIKLQLAARLSASGQRLLANQFREQVMNDVEKCSVRNWEGDELENLIAETNNTPKIDAT